MNWYELLRLTHVSCVVISVSLFIYRYARLATHPEQTLPRILFVLPHINDSVLLAAAIGMLALVGLNPLLAPWLMTKIFVLLAYIVLAAMCLRASPRSRRQAALFVGAMSAFAYILLVAATKQPFPGIRYLV